MDPKYFLVLAVMVVMGWFAFGILYNLRTGDALLRWMQNGLPRIGERTTFRWLGTSVAELVIAKARGAIRRLETLLVLAPRDVPWFWAMAAMQGRRDTLILRAQLSAPPPLDLELADPSAWTGKLALRQAAERGWESQPYRDLQLMAPRGYLPSALALLERLAPEAGQLAPNYRRFALRKEGALLELHLPFPDRRQVDADKFFEALQALARAVSERS